MGTHKNRFDLKTQSENNVLQQLEELGTKLKIQEKKSISFTKIIQGSGEAFTDFRKISCS